jgi:3-dehydroquinate dehydratase I
MEKSSHDREMELFFPQPSVKVRKMRKEEYMTRPFQIVGTVSDAATLKELLLSPEKLQCCDVVELRFDEHMDKNACLELCNNLRQYVKVLLTIRTAREGGSWSIPDNERIKLFNFFSSSVDMIDIELKSELFETNCRQEFPEQLTVIASFHDYENTPSKTVIDQLITKGNNWGADIVKLAVTPHSKSDIALLESFLNQPKLCLIGMGDLGVITRSDFPKKGSVLTYGYLDSCAAPGQLSALTLNKLLR